MNIIHSKITHIIYFLLLIIITSLQGMNEENYLEASPSFDYKEFTEDCEDVELTFRDAIFEQLPLSQHILDEIDENKKSLFKKQYLKTNGFQTIFSDNNETTLKYLGEVWKKTKAPKLTAKLATTITQYKINLTVQDVQELLRDYFIELYFQKFFVPTKDRLMHYCRCSKAPLSSKLLCIVQAVNDLPLIFPPDQCTASSPLVASFFGAGSAMNEYLLLHALAKKYQFASIHFIDKVYQTNQSFVNLFNTVNEQLQRNGFFGETSIFDSTESFQHYVKKNNLKHNLIISIDPGDKKKIKDHKAPRRATVALITLTSLFFNQQRCINMKFKNPLEIKTRSWNNTIDKDLDALDYNETMNTKINNLQEQLNTHFVNKKHESREAFAIGLQSFIKKEKRTINKESPENYFSDLELAWFKKPPIDFEDFAQPYIQPSTRCFMVHKGFREISTISQ